MPPASLMVPPSEPVVIDQSNGVLLSNIIESVKTNYAIAYENRVKLETLQSWVRLQYKLYTK